MTSGFPENDNWRAFESPAVYAVYNARQKVKWISGMMHEESGRPVSAIIGCDTVVTCSEEVLEKARDRTHAVDLLRSISGKTVKIYSGVHICYRDRENVLRTKEFFDVVDVHMKAYGDDMINGYLDLGNGMDHAAALAIQDGGIVLVQSIKGDFFSAMGFPMSRFYDELSRLLPELN